MTLRVVLATLQHCPMLTLVSAASSVMYQPTSSTTSNLTFTNGTLSAPTPHFTNNPASLSDSESDLSEAIDPPSSTSAPAKVAAQDNSFTSPDQRSEEGDLTSEDALGSDDGDYDIMDPSQRPQAANPSASPNSRSSSGGSRVLGKRKAGAEEDEFMLNDPELYGLRRSVSYTSIPHRRSL